MLMPVIIKEFYTTYVLSTEKSCSIRQSHYIKHNWQ